MGQLSYKDRLITKGVAGDRPGALSAVGHEVNFQVSGTLFIPLGEISDGDGFLRRVLGSEVEKGFSPLPGGGEGAGDRQWQRSWRTPDT